MGHFGRLAARAPNRLSRLFGTQTQSSSSLSDVIDNLAPTAAKFNVSFPQNLGNMYSRAIEFPRKSSLLFP
jgi:ABC-type transporter Mla subunit MlaD